jgi:hypothetical protein
MESRSVIAARKPYRQSSHQVAHKSATTGVSEQLQDVDRDRSAGQSPAPPPTPPGMRVRTRRSERVEVMRQAEALPARRSSEWEGRVDEQSRSWLTIRP